MNGDANNFKQRFEECSDKFDKIFELTSAASKIINSDLVILKVNHAITELLGYEAAEIEGTKILEYACPEFIQHWHELQEALWKRQLPFFKLEACLYRKDGSVAWVKVTTVLFNDKGETFGFTVLDDITYRKQFDEKENELNVALAASERTKADLSRMLDTMAEGVGIIDLNGRMTYANPMAQKILGVSEDEIKKRTFGDSKWQNLRLDGSPLPPEEHPMAIMMRTRQQVFDHEIAVQPANGERIYVSINAAPIFDENGKLTGGLGTFMDVTHRRKIIQQKDEFISIASHELKTPLTSLKGALQLLDRVKQEVTPKMLPQLVDQANKSLNKINTLVADLLNASRVNEGQLQLNKTTFKLIDLISECCEHIYLDGKHQIISTGDVDLTVNADYDRIEQVITNFVNNVTKYAPETKVIEVRFERLSDAARISVIDQGKGIPKEKQPQLFDRYYRVNTDDKQYSGLGLGLYINAEIVKKHGGEIGVESTAGQGSAFWFTLPL